MRLINAVYYFYYYQLELFHVNILFVYIDTVQVSAAVSLAYGAYQITLFSGLYCEFTLSIIASIFIKLHIELTRPYNQNKCWKLLLREV